MCLMRGMIAQTVLRKDPPYYEQMLAFWKQQVRQQFPMQSAPPRLAASAR